MNENLIGDLHPQVNTAINTLHISDNSIGCGGAQALSEALSMTNCQITDLDISGNVIASDVGGNTWRGGG